MRRRIWEAIALAAAIHFYASAAFAVTQYTVTELRAPCTWPHPPYAGLSDQGHVVAEWCSDGWLRGYIWQDGTATDLGDLGDNACVARDVNELGEVTGKAHINSSSTRAIRWTDGVITELPALSPDESYSSEGLSINVQGVVAGYSYTWDGDHHASIWEGDTISDLGTLGGDTSLARGINDLGQVVGESAVQSGQTDYDHAFLWQDGKMTDLGTFGGQSSKALGLNNQGQIVGGLVDSSGQWQPWIWEDGSITFLGSLGGTDTSPEDINDRGQIVGGSGTADEQWHAFLWENGSMHDLNDFVAADSGWLLEQASAINDLGWIAGYGSRDGEQLGFLLIPVAPPLKPGDADQDLDFDQLDLVRVQIAGKYLTGQAATWGEGDWNGAPGGSVGAPPPGDGVFDQKDFVAALAAGIYLTGPYAAIAMGGTAGDAQTSIRYDANTGELSVDAPDGKELTSVNIESASGIITGSPAQNLGGSFDNGRNIFKATFGSSFGSLSFGNVAQPGLAEDFVAGDLTVVGSLAGGSDLGSVDLIYVPEPATVVLGLWGVLVLAAGYHPRRFC